MGGFSVSAMPAMCTRLWGWQSMAGVSSLTEQLMREACPAASQHLSLWRAFGRWRQANFGTEPPPGQLCALFGGYLLSAGLKASTCVGYTLTVAKFVRLEVPHHPSPEWNAMHHLVRGLELRAAAEVPNHAPDISEERAEFILESITALDVQFSLWMLLTIGARAADLNRLEECQIGIANARVAVDFRITKVVRYAEGTLLCLPPDLDPLQGSLAPLLIPVEASHCRLRPDQQNPSQGRVSGDILQLPPVIR